MPSDPKAEFDSLVEDIWIDLNEGKLVDAVEYLEGGGQHYNVGESDAESIDRTVLLPLCERLRDEYDVKPQALIDADLGFASMILVKLPGNPLTHSAIETVIADADADFEGTIDAEWGHVWLAISLLEPGAEEYDE